MERCYIVLDSKEKTEETIKVQVFSLTLQQMLLMFSLIAVGFILRKLKTIPENANITMSRLETFVFTPALTLYTQMTKCTPETFAQHWTLLLYGLILILASMLLSYPLSRLFVRNAGESPEKAYERRIYQYAVTFGNFGFMGNFIILGVWGSDVFYQYGLLCFFLNIMCSSWGLYILIPKDKNAGLAENLKKGILTPPMIALVGGMILGLTGLARFVPDFFLSALDSAAACQGPVAMLLAGFVIGGYNFREMLLNKKVYAASAVRLLLIPSAMMLILGALGVPESVRLLALIAFGTPLGMNTVVYPSAYGGNPKTGASMAMVSHTLSVVTIPLMYMIFFVIL